MINLEISAWPKSFKYLEFSQTLEHIKADLKKYCTRLTIVEKESGFFITAYVKSNEQLSTIINSKEISILSGAIRMLCKKSKTIINGTATKNRTDDLTKIKLDYKSLKE